jgi:hypothetical protein
MFALILGVVAWLFRQEPVLPLILGVVGLIMLVIGASFQHLTVSDTGDALAISFGPLPMFHKTIRYVDMESVEVGQTTFLDGWGIHASLRGGWVWNIAGWDCVVIHYHGEILRVGTDDAENLAQFLRTKLVDKVPA